MTATFPIEAQLPAGETPSFLSDDFREIPFVQDGTPKTAYLVSYYSQPLLAGRRQDYVLFGAPQFAGANESPAPRWHFSYGAGPRLPPGTDPYYQAVMGGQVRPCAFVTWPAMSSEPARTKVSVDHVKTYEINLLPVLLYPPPMLLTTLAGRFVSSRIPLFNQNIELTLQSGYLTAHLNQAVQNVPPTLDRFIKAMGLSPADNQYFARCEIALELKPYILSAAAQANVPARLLAAIVFREMLARLRYGSPAAVGLIGARRFHPEADSFLVMLRDTIRKELGDKLFDEFKNIRDFEIDLVVRRQLQLMLDFLPASTADPARGRWITFWARKTCGVGQVMGPQAAIERGLIADPTRPGLGWHAALPGILAAYASLDNQSLVDIFNILRFPKSNILMAAKLLRRIIDKENRYQGWTPSQLLQDKKAILLVACEYNDGYSGLDPVPAIEMFVRSNGIPIHSSRTLIENLTDPFFVSTFGDI